MKKFSHKILGERIRAERKKQGLTLKELSAKAEMSLSLLSQIERSEGRNGTASISSIYKIATMLGISMGSLMDHDLPASRKRGKQ